MKDVKGYPNVMEGQEKKEGTNNTQPATKNKCSEAPTTTIKLD